MRSRPVHRNEIGTSHRQRRFLEFRFPWRRWTDIRLENVQLHPGSVVKRRRPSDLIACNRYRRCADARQRYKSDESLHTTSVTAVVGVERTTEADGEPTLNAQQDA
jgi:hypothetical protein